MVAAGAESVSNGGCGPDDTLYLSGDPTEDRPKLEKFLSRFHDAGDSCPALEPCLALGVCPALMPCPTLMPCLPFSFTQQDFDCPHFPAWP